MFLLNKKVNRILYSFQKLLDSIAAIRESVPIVCGPEAALPQVLAVNGMQESVSEIVTFSESLIHADSETGVRWVSGLSDVFYTCYQRKCLPSESGIDWAQSGRMVNLRQYRFFPGGISQ